MSTENDTRGEFNGGFDDAPPDARAEMDDERQGENLTAAAVEIDVEELRARLDERDRELMELRAELAAIRERERQAVLTGGSWLARFAAWFFIGRDLARGMRSWFEAVKRWLTGKLSLDSFPIDETADVAAAVVRRVVRVGLVGLAVAALPGALLMWQNVLLQMQIRQQAADTLIVRRAQLLATIYTEECEDPPESAVQSPEDDGKPAAEGQKRGVPPAEPAPPAEPVCKPKANPRAVWEAVLAFVEIERGRGERPDLSEANLSRATLVGADLSRAKLRAANLSGANLRAADLSGTDLYGADLSGAYLSEADLSGAVALRADLSRANLHAADLRWAWFAGYPAADLRGADLNAADLSGARISPSQLAAACGGTWTILPEDFKGIEMPETWPCSWTRDEETGEWRRVSLDAEEGGDGAEDPEPRR